MKKNFILIIISVLLVCAMGSAFAGDFILRNGIRFTDTKDIIMKKETFEFVNEYSDSIRFKGSLSDMMANVDYYFNKNSELTDMCYSFGNYKADFFGLLFTNSTDMNNGYSVLRDNLISKYGQPLGNNDTLDVVTGKAFEKYFGMDSAYGFTPGYKCVPSDYDEWVVLLENGDIVKIDLISYKMKFDDKNGYIFNYINLSYKYVPAEEYSNLKEKQDTAQQAIKDAL